MKKIEPGKRVNDRKCVVGMRMDSGLHAKLKRLCNEKGVTVTDFITEYVTAATKGMRKQRSSK